jgi:hypothetical protein
LVPDVGATNTQKTLSAKQLQFNPFGGLLQEKKGVLQIL